jgi:DNA-binding Lrp family transcriptional regulator
VLDELDRALIHALRIDGRAPYSRLAEALEVSAQTVARRYQRLRAEAGLRVVGVLDARTAGQAQWLVRLTAGPHAAQDLARSLARRADTSWVKLTSGGTEITTIINTSMHPAENSLLLRDIPRTAAITAVSAHLLLHVYQGGPRYWRGPAGVLTSEQRGLLESRGAAADPVDPVDPGAATGAAAAGDAPAPSSPPSPLPTPSTSDEAGSRPYPLTPSDHGLLAGLRQDGRASHAELAVGTGLSPATVARRLADLEAAGALFYDVEVDSVLLGAPAQALLWMSVAPADQHEVATTLAGHEELAFVAATTGPSNLVANALCSDPDDLHRYLVHRLGALPAIRSIETAPVLRTLKASGPWQAYTSTSTVPK